jgi:hypothetical protein
MWYGAFVFMGFRVGGFLATVTLAGDATDAEPFHAY